MADEAVKRIIIDLIPESKPFFEVMPEYDGERQTVILDPGLVQKAFWEIIQWGSEASWKKISKELVDNSIDVSSWNKGSFDSVQDSVARHYCKHGAEVGATNVVQYIRKAEGFAQNLRGTTRFPVGGAVEGVTRYVKNGKYIDLAPDGTIVSYGKR